MKKISNFIKKNLALLIILLIAVIILLIGSINMYKSTHNIHPDLSTINTKGVNKLMIVAHPDDEILWGGAHLIKDDYLVVCITCGVKYERVVEFVKVMNATEDKYVMLGYPDKTNGERDNWETVYDDIKGDLKQIIELKDWELIVTHNPDGEYGHQHHKLTNEITTSVVENKDKLYYFGHYHSKKTISDYYATMVSIPDSLLRQKKKIIGMYRSQNFIQTSFDQMFPYEEWLTYEEWNSELNEESK